MLAIAGVSTRSGLKSRVCICQYWPCLPATGRRQAYTSSVCNRSTAAQLPTPTEAESRMKVPLATDQATSEKTRVAPRDSSAAEDRFEVPLTAESPARTAVAHRGAAGRARFGINASIIGSNPTGLGIYSIKLIRALDRIRDDFIVYSSSHEALMPLRAPIERTPIATRPDFGPRGHLVRLLWLQSVLRLRLRGADSGCFSTPSLRESSACESPK